MARKIRHSNNFVYIPDPSPIEFDPSESEIRLFPVFNEEGKFNPESPDEFEFLPRLCKDERPGNPLDRPALYPEPFNDEMPDP